MSIIQLPNDTPKDFTKIDYAKFKHNADVLLSNDWKIASYSYIDNDIMKLLNDYANHVNITSLFKEDKQTTAYYYKTHVTCSQCAISYDKVLTKTKLIEYIKKGTVLCDNCLAQNKAQKQSEQDAKEAELKELKYQNTDEYIGLYLMPTSENWSTDVSIHDRYITISRQFVNWDDIENIIKDMDYKDFLSTLYWKAISSEKKRKVGFRCQLCGNKNKLEVHHRTYTRHGKEHICAVMNTDLIVLCDKCHKKFHNIGE